MSKTISHGLRQSVAVVAAAMLFTACSQDGPVAPTPTDEAIATLRSATSRYQDLNVAKAEGFVFLHGCEVRPGEGPVGIVYVHMDRLMDGAIDPTKPDALIYAPNGDHPTLVGVELAVPYPLWTKQEPPKFLDGTFQAEDEFGVFGLHVWVWRENPNGLFAESNPKVSC
jgi:hypothetical protein